VVEHLLAKEKVAGSNPVFRSKGTHVIPGILLSSENPQKFAPEAMINIGS
jgi:hypothetical protein